MKLSNKAHVKIVLVLSGPPRALELLIKNLNNIYCSWSNKVRLIMISSMHFTLLWCIYHPTKLTPNMQTNVSSISIIQSRFWTPSGCFKMKVRLLVLIVATLAVAITAATSVPKPPLRLTPAMEETLRAVIEEQLEQHPEMKFNVTRLREIEEGTKGKDGTNDDTVRCFSNYILQVVHL